MKRPQEVTDKIVKTRQENIQSRADKIYNDFITMYNEQHLRSKYILQQLSEKYDLGLKTIERILQNHKTKKEEK